MQTIPLQAVPSQSLSVLLASQNCQINVYQKSTGLFIDLSMNNSPVLTTVICRDRVRLIRQSYHGFVGDLAFVDTQGKSDPDYAGLAGRFALAYLEAADLL